MALSSRVRWRVLLLVIPLAALFYGGLEQIPFHPDETSLLYQSRDLERMFSSPADLIWNPGREDLDQQYRTLNPPLPKYILAVGRILAGYGPSAVAQDWDWGATWEQNVAAGALPSPALLAGPRAASATLALAGVALIGLVGLRLHGPAAAALAIVLMGLNALVLLHGRRAMAEGTLLFAVSLALLAFLNAPRRPGLAGVAAGLAAASKLSAAALAPIGLLAAAGLFSRAPGQRDRRSMGVAALRYLGALALTFLALNPFLWRNPLQASLELLRARRALVAEQQRDLLQRSPKHVLLSPSQRTAGMITELFLTPPRFSEYANYRQQTAAAEAHYLSNPLHNLFRGLFFGAVNLILTTAGIAFGVLHLARGSLAQGEPLLVLAASSLAMAVALWLAVPLPYQRYYLPLVPMISLWAAYALATVAGKSKTAASQSKRP